MSFPQAVFPNTIWKSFHVGRKYRWNGYGCTIVAIGPATPATDGSTATDYYPVVRNIWNFHFPLHVGMHRRDVPPDRDAATS